MPVSLKVGAGKPVAVTVNEPAVPAVKVVLFTLVIAGAWLTVIPLCVPVIELVTVSVAVMDWIPPVFNVALKLRVPLSPATKV
jgi:hypothetical protein